MRIGDVYVDFTANQIEGTNGPQSVEPKVMEVLVVLVQHAGEVVTRKAIIDEVWGVEFGGDERLSRAISILRKSFGNDGETHNYIQTIPKTGYKLTVAVHEDLSVAAQKEDAKQGNNKTAPSTTLELKTPKVKISNQTLALLSMLIAAIVFTFFWIDTRTAPQEPPLVIIMDSAHPARIYDDAVRDEGGTNADILSDILADLPVRIQKELISPNWHRFEPMLQFQPELIVVHYSGFKQEDASGDRPQLRLLVEYFEKTDTQFLVYSRASEAWLQENLDRVLQMPYEANPTLRSRIQIFPLLEYGEPGWIDQDNAQLMKLRVKEILNLQ